MHVTTHGFEHPAQALPTLAQAKSISCVTHLLYYMQSLKFDRDSGEPPGDGEESPGINKNRDRLYIAVYRYPTQIPDTFDWKFLLTPKYETQSGLVSTVYGLYWKKLNKGNDVSEAWRFCCEHDSSIVYPQEDERQIIARFLIAKVQPGLDARLHEIFKAARFAALGDVQEVSNDWIKDAIRILRPKGGDYATIMKETDLLENIKFFAREPKKKHMGSGQWPRNALEVAEIDLRVGLETK